MISDYEKAVGMTYSEAREYLKSIGRWDDVSDQDGFSIVQYAIELKDNNRVFNFEGGLTTKTYFDK